MEFEKYTDRAKGFLQSAQTMALRRGHQRLTPEHLLKVLLEDSEGLCANLIRVAGGDPKLWQAILTANRQHVLDALDVMGQTIGNIRESLEQGDNESLLSILEAAAKKKRDRDALGD